MTCSMVFAYPTNQNVVVDLHTGILNNDNTNFFVSNLGIAYKAGIMTNNGGLYTISITDAIISNQPTTLNQLNNKTANAITNVVVVSTGGVATASAPYVITVSATNYQLTVANQMLFLSGVSTAKLPSAAGNSGIPFWIIKTDNNTVSAIATTNGGMIGVAGHSQSSNFTFNVQGTSLPVVSDGNVWWVY